MQLRIPKKREIYYDIDLILVRVRLRPKRYRFYSSLLLFFSEEELVSRNTDSTEFYGAYLMTFTAFLEHFC